MHDDFTTFGGDLNHGGLEVARGLVTGAPPARCDSGLPAGVISALCGKVTEKPTPENGNHGGRECVEGVSACCLEVFPDWVEFTFKATKQGTPYELETVLSLLGGDPESWDDTAAGFRGGYKSGKERGAVKVYYDGREDMGIHVVIPGEGCRQLEEEGFLDDGSEEFGLVGGWRGFLGDLRGWGAKFSRFDLATDDRRGALDLEAIKAAIEGKQIDSKFEDARPDWSYDLKTGEVTGKTAYFGHPSSDFRVRMYEKRLEQLQRFRKLPKEERAQRVAELPAIWNRAELVTRRKHANALVDMFVEQGPAVVSEVLSRYINFKEGAWSGWLPFLGLLQRATGVSLAIYRRAKQTLERVKLHLSKQWGAWIAAVQMADGPDALQDIAKVGRSRLDGSKNRNKYLRTVRDYWRDLEDSGLRDPFELALIGAKEGYAL